jgi:NO-binding membrane sensor protein with MHYT domain
MAAKYILAALAVIFFVLAARQRRRTRDRRDPRYRTWILISGIFGGVSVWLFTH